MHATDHPKGRVKTINRLNRYTSAFNIPIEVELFSGRVFRKDMCLDGMLR